MMENRELLKIPENTAVHCPTIEDASLLLRYITDDVFIMGNYIDVWQKLEGETCYSNSEYGCPFEFSRRGYYEDKGYSIISVENFINGETISS